MKYELIDPNIVVPSPWNANVVSHENEEKLKASIERLGMFKPLLIRELSDGTLECIGGWHRCEQAIELDYDKVPAINLGPLDDDRAKEISLADNARYGVDDTLKLNSLLADLDHTAIEAILPWTERDIAAITQSLNVNIEDLDIDAPTLPADDEEDDAPPTPKAQKTHQLIRFSVPNSDAARISKLITQTMADHGFTKDNDLTNAGDALAYLLLKEDDDVAA